MYQPPCDFRRTEPSGRGVATIRQAAAARPAPPPITFDNGDLPRDQRLDAWNAAFGALNGIRLLPDQDDDARVRSENWTIGGLVLGVNMVSPSLFERNAAHARRDGLDHWVIRVLRHGTNQLRLGGFVGTVLPGQPLLFSMHETWTSRWTRAEWVSLSIPRDLDPQMSLGLSRLQQGPILGPLGDMLGDILLTLPARMRQARPDEFPALAEAARMMVAGCLLSGGVPQVAARDAWLSQKERVRRAIRQHIGSARLTPARLAQLAGISRSSLYRLFETEGGVARYVQAVRLSLAQAEICNPARAADGIAAIAEAHGFPDASAFTRAFRQAYGMSPREARAAALRGSPPVEVRPPLDASPAPSLVKMLYGRATMRTGRQPAPEPCLPQHSPSRVPAGAGCPIAS